VAVLLFVAGCAADLKAETVSAPPSAFAAHRAFSIGPPPAAPSDTHESDITNALAKAAEPLVATELSHKRYQEAAPGTEGDLTVRVGCTATTMHHSPRRERGTGETIPTPDTTIGTFVVDVMDAKGEQRLWHGQTTAELDSSGDNNEIVRNAVTAVLKGFPSATAN